MKGKKPINMRKVIIDNITYESITDASRNLSVSPGTIIFRINPKVKIFNHIIM